MDTDKYHTKVKVKNAVRQKALATQSKENQKLLKNEEFIELVGGLDNAEFYLAWIATGRNATEAYLMLHPDVKRETASVSGSLALGKIKNKSVILASFNLTPERIFAKIEAGMEATKLEDDGESIVERPDHYNQREYVKLAGQLTGVLTKDTGTNITINTGKMDKQAIEDIIDAEIIE